MKYKTAQLRREWNRLAKREHRIICTPAELRSTCFDRHMNRDKRYFEMASYQSKDGVTHEIEF